MIDDGFLSAGTERLAMRRSKLRTDLRFDALRQTVTDASIPAPADVDLDAPISVPSIKIRFDFN